MISSDSSILSVLLLASSPHIYPRTGNGLPWKTVCPDILHCRLQCPARRREGPLEAVWKGSATRLVVERQEPHVGRTPQPAGVARSMDGWMDE